MEPGGAGTVLVGVDESTAAAEAVELAVSVAAAYDATLYVLEVRAVGAAEAVATGELAPEVAADRSQERLATAREAAAAADVPVRTGTAIGYSTTRKRTHPGSVVLDIAEDVDAGFLVVPRESEASPAERGTLARVARYALQYASQPVLSV